MDRSDWQCEGTMAKAQRDAIEAALVACDYSIASAAKRLRIGRSTIYRLLRAYEMRVERTLDDAPKIEMRRSPPGRAKLPTSPTGPKVVLRQGGWYLEQGA
jgi:hypothetical protein